MKQLGDILCINNYFTEPQLWLCEKNLEQIEASRAVHSYGVFPNQLIAEFKHLSHDQEIMNMFYSSFSELFNCDKKIIDIPSVYVTKLFLPWDVHSDLYLNYVKDGFRYGFNFLIPLHDVHSRTIIFDQWSETSNEFAEYKKVNSKVENPISEEFWQENLSMCWPIDREYLTIKKVLPYQKRGQLLGFNRKFFHSSDNFHVRGIKEKSFIQVRVDFAI